MNKYLLFRLMTPGIIILSLTTMGYAAVWGDPRTGLILKYHFPQDQTLNYKNDSDAAQSFEVNGQSMKTTTKIKVDYGFKGTGVDDKNNLMAQVIINSINIAFNGPQGTINANTSGLNGKSFYATYSPEGKELEVTGIEDLPKFSMGQGGERDVTEFFSIVLPELPDVPVKTGDSWTTPIDRNTQQGPLALTLKGEATNVLEGIETIKGMECVKIKTLAKYTIQGSGTQMGQEINLKGDTKETSTWYFAYKKGLLVKITSDKDNNINLDMGPMKIPQTTKTKYEVELVL